MQHPISMESEMAWFWITWSGRHVPNDKWKKENNDQSIKEYDPTSSEGQGKAQIIILSPQAERWKSDILLYSSDPNSSFDFDS